MRQKGLIFIILLGVGYAEKNYETVTAARYGSGFLHCNTSGHDFWWTDGKNRTIRGKSRKYNVFQNGTLKVDKMTWDDVGVYKCHIRDTIRSTTIIKLEINTETIVSSVHSNVTLICKAEVPRNLKSAVYKFYVFDSNGSEILLCEDGKLTEQGKVFGKGRLMTTENTRLQINGIRKRDQGKFLCTVWWKSEHHQGHSVYFFNVEIYGESTRRPTLQNKTEQPKELKKRNPKSSGKMMEKNIWYFTVLMSIVALKSVVK